MITIHQYRTSPIYAKVDRTDPLFVDVSFHTHCKTQCSLALKITGQILQTKDLLFYMVPNNETKKRMHNLFTWIASISMFGNEDPADSIVDTLADTIFIDNVNPDAEGPGTQYFKIEHSPYHELILNLPDGSTASVDTPIEKEEYMRGHALVHECTFQADFVGTLLTNNTKTSKAVLYATVNTSELTFGCRKAPIPFYRNHVTRQFTAQEKIPLHVRRENRRQKIAAKIAERGKAMRDKKRSQMDHKEYDETSQICAKFIYPSEAVDARHETQLPVDVDWNPYEPVSTSPQNEEESIPPPSAIGEQVGEGGVQTVTARRPKRDTC